MIEKNKDPESEYEKKETGSCDQGSDAAVYIASQC